jgi:hypothetical protein
MVKIVPKSRRVKLAAPVYYIGSVIRTGQLKGPEVSWEIQCMRRHEYSLCKFVYPQVLDVSSFYESDIIKVLQQPKVVHLIHHFSDDFTEYAYGLR